MAKLAITVLMAVLVCQGYSKPLQDGDIAKEAAAGDWDGVHRTIKQYVNSRVSAPQLGSQSFGSIQGQVPSFSSAEITNSGSGGRFFSQSEYSFQQRKTDKDGVVSEDKGGLGMINDNGRVSYYKPQQNANAAPLVAPYGK